MAASRVSLNFNRTWAEVGAIVTSRDDKGKPNGWVRDAFKGGIADKVKLDPGTKLYKFNGSQLLIDMSWQRKQGITLEAAVTVSPWWSPYEEFKHKWSKESGQNGVTIDPGWFAKKAMAARFGVNIREWGRITSAVKESWNPLKYLLVITLKHETHGFFGGFTAMARQEGSGSTRFGNEARLESKEFAKKATPNGFTSAGMKDRIKRLGNHGSLAGGGTQFYIPNIRSMNISSWNIENLFTKDEVPDEL